MTHGRVTAVCVTRDLQSRTRVSTELTGINKAAVDQISLTPVGVRDDQVLDTNDHGGVDKAAYVYADEDAGWWSEELGIQIPPGRFGENLRVRAMPVSDAVIGERWQMGSDVVVEVSEPRVPCSTFQHHMDDRRGWVKRSTQVGRPGSYLRVITGGDVAAGDTVTLLSRPAHGVSIGRWFTTNDPDDARALLAAESDEWHMGQALRRHVDRVVARSTTGR